MAFFLNRYEASILWDFFDGVSTAIATRMANGSSPGEENLTFLLCELLDDNSTSRHVLPYPLSKAKLDLEKSDTGITCEVEFQTHEHTKFIESKYSRADLGIVLEIDHPLFGQSRRGILVQAKRLFPHREDRRFSLDSEYSSFDPKQFADLQRLEERFGVQSSVLYLWYNPPLSEFSDVDVKYIKAYLSAFENREEIWFPYPWHNGEHEAAERLRRWRSSQPALRFSLLERLAKGARKMPARPRLRTLCESLEWDTWGFLPFAAAFILSLQEEIGSDSEAWVQLAEGRVNNRSGQELIDSEATPIPRHTLKVRIRSTLPLRG